MSLVPGLWEPGWGLPHWRLGDTAVPIHPRGPRCTFRALPAQPACPLGGTSQGQTGDLWPALSALV